MSPKHDRAVSNPENLEALRTAAVELAAPPDRLKECTGEYIFNESNYQCVKKPWKDWGHGADKSINGACKAEKRQGACDQKLGKEYCHETCKSDDFGAFFHEVHKCSYENYEGRTDISTIEHCFKDIKQNHGDLWQSNDVQHGLRAKRPAYDPVKMEFLLASQEADINAVPWNDDPKIYNTMEKWCANERKEGLYACTNMSGAGSLCTPMCQVLAARDSPR